MQQCEFVFVGEKQLKLESLSEGAVANITKVFL